MDLPDSVFGIRERDRRLRNEPVRVYRSALSRQQAAGNSDHCMCEVPYNQTKTCSSAPVGLNIAYLPQMPTIHRTLVGHC